VPPKKRKFGLVLGAAVALVLLAAFAGAAFLTQGFGLLGPTDPAGVANGLVSAAANGRSSTVTKYYPAGADQSDSSAFVVDALGGSVPPGAFTLSAKTDTSATVTLKGADGVSYAMTLKPSNGSWRVTEIARFLSEQTEESYDAETVTKETPLLPDGVKYQVSSGTSGTRKVLVVTPYRNGEEGEPERIPGAVIEKAVAPVVVLGTGPALDNPKTISVSQEDLIVTQSISFGTADFGISKNEFAVGAKFEAHMICPDGTTVSGVVQVNDGKPDPGYIGGWTFKTLAWTWTPREVKQLGYSALSVDAWLPGQYLLIVTVDGKTVGYGDFQI